MRRIDVYQPPQFDAPIDLDLSKNEGSPPAQITSILSGIGSRTVSRYPDSGPLRAALARRFGLAPESVLVTAGGDDALARCFQANAGRRIVSTTPSFEMIRRYAAQTQSELTEVPWWSEGFPLDEFNRLAAEADVAVVVSPNNPTGSVIAADDLEAIAAAAPLVVLDAAYAEFADDDVTDTALGLSNVVTVRTLSKAFGMAGLRVGCLLGDPEQVRAIAAFGSPYAVSGVSIDIAGAILDQTDGVPPTMEDLSRRRTRLYEAMEGLGMSPLPSQANFVLARDASAWVVEATAAMGIAIRSFPDSDDLAGCVRITVPETDLDLTRLLATLETALAPEAIIFDLDGVIADVSSSYRQAIIETGASFETQITPGQIAEAKAAGNANDDWSLTWRLLTDRGVQADLAEVTERFETIYQGDSSRPGLKESERPLVDRHFLEKLAVGYRLAVVTGRPRSDANEFLERWGLTDLFDAVVTREDALPKPDPAPVRLAMERVGSTRAWMLGDTVDDLQAARAAGALPIGVIAPGDDPEHARETLSAAAAVLETPTELKGLIDDKTS